MRIVIIIIVYNAVFYVVLVQAVGSVVKHITQALF